MKNHKNCNIIILEDQPMISQLIQFMHISDDLSFSLQNTSIERVHFLEL